MMIKLDLWQLQIFSQLYPVLFNVGQAYLSMYIPEYF